MRLFSSGKHRFAFSFQSFSTQGRTMYLNTFSLYCRGYPTGHNKRTQPQRHATAWFQTVTTALWRLTNGVGFSLLGTGNRQQIIPLYSSAGRQTTGNSLWERERGEGGTCVSRCLIMHHYSWEPITLPAAWVNIKSHYDSSNINSLAVLTCMMMEFKHKIFWPWLNILKEFT